MDGGGIALRLGLIQLELGRNLLYFRQTQQLQSPDVVPAHVELVPAVGETGRARVRMVIVVQLLSADEYSPRHDVGARVFGLEVAVAPVVTDAVDDACREEGDPGHL